MCKGGSASVLIWTQAPSPRLTMCCPALSWLRAQEALGAWWEVVLGDTGALSPLNVQSLPTGLLLPARIPWVMADLTRM